MYTNPIMPSSGSSSLENSIDLGHNNNINCNNLNSTNLVSNSTNNNRFGKALSNAFNFLQSNKNQSNNMPTQMMSLSNPLLLDASHNEVEEPNIQISNSNVTDSQSEIDDSTEDREFNISCKCTSHPGKELLNKVFNLSVDYIFDCLFGLSEFNKRYWNTRKFDNIKISEWQQSIDKTACEIRTMDYNITLNAFGKLTNNEQQKILVKIPNKCLVIESISSTQGVIYSDYFKTITRFCITKCTTTTSRLLITASFNYLKQPNFIIKDLIESKSFNTMKEVFNSVGKNLNEEKELPPCKRAKRNKRKSITSNYNPINSYIENQNESLILKKDSIRLDETYPQTFSSELQNEKSLYFKFTDYISKIKTDQNYLINILLMIFLILIFLNTILQIRLTKTQNDIDFMIKISETYKITPKTRLKETFYEVNCCKNQTIKNEFNSLKKLLKGIIKTLKNV